MKTIHKSAFKELLAVFALSIVSLNFVLITERLLSITKVLASVGASIADMAVIVLYLQPQLSILTTPMALLIATLLTYGRMNSDNEITVMRAAGMSFRQISMPVFALGVICFIACVILGFFIAPYCSGRLGDRMTDVIASRASNAVEEGIFNTTFKGIIIYVQKKSEKSGLEGVFIYDERRENNPVVLYADKGKIGAAKGGDITLSLDNGRIYLGGKDEASTELIFGRYRMTVPVRIQTPTKELNEMTPLELLKESRRGEKRESVMALLEFHRRLSLPAACLLLMLFGPPLALVAGKTGRLGGLALGIGVFAAYYAAIMYFEKLARSGAVPHYIGAWAPALMLGVLAVIMFMREEAR